RRAVRRVAGCARPAAAGIDDGDPVRAWNKRGEVQLVARLSDRVQPGLIASYMVRWGANANATTPDEAADMGGNSTFHSNYVTIDRVEENGASRERA
ncbi:MAG: hypothetical protein OXG37_08585, partial [Actinomycetia bacterium]|nr:hypothetical protein [Actinomycetes bacterium]